MLQISKTLKYYHVFIPMENFPWFKFLDKIHDFPLKINSHHQRYCV